jgi:hypothetical protein
MGTKQKILEQIKTKIKQLCIANDTYEKLLTKEIDSYSFGSGEGNQSTHRRGLEELRKQIESLEKDIGELERKLSNSGLVSIAVRRG